MILSFSLRKKNTDKVCQASVITLDGLYYSNIVINEVNYSIKRFHAQRIFLLLKAL